jgi:transposase InsO family protein
VSPASRCPPASPYAATSALARELLHVDIKKLGRFWTIGKRIRGDRRTRSEGAGWQYLHVAIDDHSRLAYAELLPSEGPGDCVAFLRRASSWYGERDIAIERVLSDNGNGYRSHAWAATCAELAIARRYTRPRRPETNGKAEALIKTLLREWAYRFAYPTSIHRARALPGYLRWYNQHRPHSSLGGRSPISRVSQVCGSHN